MLHLNGGRSPDQFDSRLIQNVVPGTFDDFNLV